MEKIVIIAIVFLSTVLLIWQLIRMFKGNDCSCSESSNSGKDACACCKKK